MIARRGGPARLAFAERLAQAVVAGATCGLLAGVTWAVLFQWPPGPATRIAWGVTAWTVYAAAATASWLIPALRRRRGVTAALTANAQKIAALQAQLAADIGPDAWWWATGETAGRRLRITVTDPADRTAGTWTQRRSADLGAALARRGYVMLAEATPTPTGTFTVPVAGRQTVIATPQEGTP